MSKKEYINISIEKNQCKFCKKILSRYDSLKRHELKCKELKYNELKFNIKNNDVITIQEENSMLKKEILEMKSILLEFMNKNCKIHPKQLQKINKQLNGNNNIINENNAINNGTVNNTFILALGKENLPELFTKKEKLKVLNARCNNVLPFLVEYTHFNNKYPQFIRLDRKKIFFLF